MKHLMIITIFLMSSMAFGSHNQSTVDYSKRFSEAFSMAENSLALTDVDRFKSIIEIAIEALESSPEYRQKGLDIEAANALIESAEGSLETTDFNRLKSRVNRL